MTDAAELEPSPAELDELRSGVLAEIQQRQLRSRVLRAIVAGAAAVAVVGTTAGVMAPKPAPIEEQNTSFSCYLEPRATARAPLDVGRLDFDPSHRTTLLPAADRVDDALALCAARYAETRATVAHPTACLLKDLRIGVFPNAAGANPATFCASLGLSVPR